ncbi:hypothetical protein Tco_0159766 [Tanacetum coccineum]
MLDRTDFESWQQKDNEENIMKSINEGPFHMGTVSDVIAGRTEGAVQQGPVRARVLNDLSAEEKERYKADIGIFVGYAPSRKGYRIYNKRTRRLMETIHVTFDEMHQSMAPVCISSGPVPVIMTPGQLKLGLAPTDKELEMLFQPMFDEHLEQSRVNEPIPSATEFNAQVVPPLTSASSSTSDIHLPVQHQEIAEEPIQEDTPIIHDVLPPLHNLVTGDGPKIILWITSLAIPLVLYLPENS